MRQLIDARIALLRALKKHLMIAMLQDAQARGDELTIAVLLAMARAEDASG